MNFNIVNASLVVVGAILIYCGVKDITPKAALQEIISGSGSNKSVAPPAPTGPPTGGGLAGGNNAGIGSVPGYGAAGGPESPKLSPR